MTSTNGYRGERAGRSGTQVEGPVAFADGIRALAFSRYSPAWRWSGFLGARLVGGPHKVHDMRGPALVDPLLADLLETEAPPTGLGLRVVQFGPH